jgi:hypothetical protein
MFDADGNLWSGMNWLPGSQSGVNKSTGGGVVKFTPNGVPLSPPIIGFTGMGIDGVGWGTAVTKDRVWISSFNGKILVMDFNGKPVATENDFPFKEKFLGLMGIGVSASGDVWIADGSDNQLLFFPGGRIKDGRIVKVAGLKSPFDIVIDDENRVWVGGECFRVRCVGIGLMRLVEIDVIGLEAPERALDRRKNMSLRKALLAAHLHAHLGRNDDARAISAALHPISDYGFGFATLMPWDPC